MEGACVALLLHGTGGEFLQVVPLYLEGFVSTPVHNVLLPSSREPAAAPWVD